MPNDVRLKKKSVLCISSSRKREYIFILLGVLPKLMPLVIWLRVKKPLWYYMKQSPRACNSSLLGGKPLLNHSIRKMFPLLFLVYVVAVKVFKKTTPNGKHAPLTISKISSKNQACFTYTLPAKSLIRSKFQFFAIQQKFEKKSHKRRKIYILHKKNV